MRRIFNVRKRFDTKERLRRKQQVDNRDTVSRWWNAKKSSEYLNEYGEEFVDYMGDLPWPRVASLEFLHKVFVKDTGVPMTKLEFCGYIRNELKIVGRGIPKSVHIRRDDGRLLRITGRTFYEIY